MNRLIIVGNGFDLAHGLKTSYCHFLNHYLKRLLQEFINMRIYDDPLIHISYNTSEYIYRYPYTPIEDHEIPEILKEIQEYKFIELNFKSSLLERCINKAHEMNWVDIENEFFEELKKCSTHLERESERKRLIEINDQFGYLKNRLEDYLIEIQIDLKKFKRDPEIYKLLFQQIRGDEILLGKYGNATPGKTLFLNFNYTNTLFKYAEKYINNVPIKTEINHIHGELKNPNNKIIFGFGDEYDEDYIKFEKLKNNNLFRHIKSFSYFKTTNYHKLIRFLNLKEFQVYIIGHSCGLSDRTMFRKIFEHVNCLSIKVFYHKREDGTTDFTDKTYDIARHFTDKGMLRDKLVSEELLAPFPQYNEKLKYW